MAKKPMRCLFSDKICVDCPLYRGRHYFIGDCQYQQDHTNRKNEAITDREFESVDFEKIKKLAEPWSIKLDKIGESACEPKIKLKIIDMETGKENFSELHQAKKWNWDDPNVMRVVAGTHINSWAKLSEIASYQKEKGIVELVIYEAPRFMLIGGG